MTKKKVFISMGMKGKTTEEVTAEMQNVFKQIQEEYPDTELIDSVIDEDCPEEVKVDSIGIWYLGKSLELLSEADLVFFVYDWIKYRGCRIERTVAEEYGKACICFKNN